MMNNEIKMVALNDKEMEKVNGGYYQTEIRHYGNSGGGPKYDIPKKDN